MPTDPIPVRAKVDTPADPPPLLGSWRNIHCVVLGELALLVIVFALLRWWAES